jgi:hypothetical protein
VGYTWFFDSEVRIGLRLRGRANVEIEALGGMGNKAKGRKQQ